ncbi:MAG: cupin domain-containing protein [Acidimicrobiia bacterium]
MTFIPGSSVERERLEWGEAGWVARPANVPESTKITAIDVRLDPGEGHDFHKHPNQDEIIYLWSGTLEQWIGDERRIMSAGDSCFVPMDTVHASFVPEDAPPARIFVVLSPSFGADGYEAVEVSHEEPWNMMRS